MLKFAFELVDRASGPANRISASLDKISKGLAKADAGSLNKAEQRLARYRGTLDKAGFGVRVAFGDKAADMLDRFTKGELKVADKAEIVRAGMGAAGKGLRSVASAATFAMGAMVAFGAAAVGAGAAGAKLLLDAQMFKDTTGAALKFTQGSSKAAASTMADIARIANLLGKSTVDMTAAFREINAAGFDNDESLILMQFAADLKAANAGKDISLSAITDPLRALKRNEGLTVDSFKGLQEAGLSQKEVYSRLADGLGLVVNKASEKDVSRKVDAALAKVRRGQVAIDKFGELTMKAMGQKVMGETTEDFQLKTTTGLLDTIQSRWSNLLKLVNTSEGESGLAKILQKVADVLDPTSESGRELLATLDKIVAKGTEVAKVFGGGFFDGFKEAKGTIMEVSEALNILGGSSGLSADSLKAIGKAMGYVVVGIGLVIGGVIWLEVQLALFAVKIFKAAANLGSKVIDGIVEGIQAGKRLLTGAVETIADLIPGTAGKKLEVRSPSRVMMRLGSHTTEGFVQGVEGGADDVSGAARRTLAEPVVRATVAPSGGRRGSVTIAPGAVQITLHGSDVDGDEIARLVDANLRRLLADVGLEVGAAPS